MLPDGQTHLQKTEDKLEFTVEDIYPTSTRYQPLRDRDLHIIESSENYVSRMRISVLPNWPNELLTEWLYRHAESIEKYTFLQFESFTFARDRWKLANIPRRESFEKESFCDDFCRIKERAHDGHDWLANYMLREGTWNTPVVFLGNTFAQHRFPDGKLMKAPYHLLEGHRRLSFLVGLRKLRRANPEHDIWVVTAPLAAASESKKKKAVP